MVMERTYRGISADERRALRRRQLLDAALDLWGDPDSKVTMTAICQGAHLTERYFYESFSNLDQALIAVVDEIAERVQRATVTALVDAGDDPVERVTVVVAAFVHTMVTDPRVGRAALIEAAGPEVTRPRRELLLRRLARLAAREARKLNGPAAWSEDDGPLLATMFVGGIAQAIATSLEDGSTEPAEIVEAATHAFRALTA